MECEKYRELISLYIDGELNESEEKELLEHIKNCPLCEKELKELTAISEMLKSAEEEELPENFHNEVMAKIRTRQAKPAKKKRSWAKYTGIAASICALLIVGSVVAVTGVMNFGGMGAADAASPETYGVYNNSSRANYKSESTVSEAAVEDREYEYADNDTTTAAGAEPENTIIDNELKIIKSANVDIRVKAFDDTMDAIRAEVDAKNGYVESSNSYVYNTWWVGNEKISTRQGYITIRVPAEDYSEVFEYVKTLGTVENESESTDNVTSAYIDTESRMEAKKTEAARLVELLAKAESVDDIISIEGRLSEVRGEIDSYTSQLKSWDKQVNYSTISITVTEEADETFSNVSPDLGTRIKNSFIRGINRFTNGLENLAVGFVGSIIYIAIIVIIIVAVVAAVKKKIRKRRSNEDKK